MNVRHLEIFHHVVRNAGINRAVGRMPFGIQQPAISEQIQLLEDSLQCRLFERQPFRLNPEGHCLYQRSREFFESLAPLAQQIRGGLRSRLRIAADEMLLPNFLSAVARNLSQLRTNLSFEFSSGPSDAMQRSLREGRVDLVVTLCGDIIPPGCCARKIVALPLVLMVDRSSHLKSAEELWSSLGVRPQLICTEPGDAVAQSFRRGLQRGDISWPTSTVVASVASVGAFVAGGNGIGVSLASPFLASENVRVLPLAGFDPVNVCALWMPTDSQRLRPLVACIRSHARLMSYAREAERA